MILATTLLALALSGMDDTASKPAPAAQGSAEVMSKADARTAPQTSPWDSIRQGAQELTQGEQAGLLSETLTMPLPKVAKPRMCCDPEWPQLPKVAKPRMGGELEVPEPWPMTLQTAIRIGLENSEVMRVISFGAQGIPIGGFEPTSLKSGESVPTSDVRPAPIVIARLNADASASRFKTDVMALVRSIEQQYWALAQAHVRAWAADKAVSVVEEVVKTEQAELTPHGNANEAEAAQRLKQLKLELVTRKSDVLTSERQLRNILELPPADNRHIIPVTPPLEAGLEFGWDRCLEEMLDQSPEIAQRKIAVRKLRDAVAIASAIVTVSPVTAHSGPQGPEITKNDLENRERITQRETELEQTIRQQVHSLARTFLSIDASDKTFQTAKRLKAAAAARLDAQRAYYAEGRITIDRFLDAVSQYAMAVGTEAQHGATYNVAIVALKEAKGTLLADYGIVVADGPRPRRYIAAQQGKTDAAAKPAAFVAEQ